MTGEWTFRRAKELEAEKARERERTESAPIREIKGSDLGRSESERSDSTFRNVLSERSDSERPKSERSPVERFTAKSGFTKLPNTILDSVLPILEPKEQVVFLRLYRLSWGFGEPECTVSVPALAAATRVSRTQIFGVLARLEQLQLIERARVGRGRLAGTCYRIQRFSDEEGKRSDLERSGLERSDLERSKSGPIKERESKRNDLKPAVAAAPPAMSVYDVRRIAARFRELHHGESNYSRERLKADVRTALIGEGREPDERLIDEAIGA